jgi:putative peptidoglycan lipid II flippase
MTLQAYAIGLAPFILVRCLVPGFYSRGDTATPVRIAAVALFINIMIKIVLIDPFGFNLGIVEPMGPEGIALGTAAGAIVNAVLLGFILARRKQLRIDGDLLHRALMIIAAGAVMGAAIYAVPLVVDTWFPGEGVIARLVRVAAIVAAGGITYAIALAIFQYPLFRELRAALTRRTAKS